MKSVIRFLQPIAWALLFVSSSFAAAPIKVMLLTGQSNRFHDWTKSSPLVKQYLEETGIFAVDVVTAPPKDVEKSDFNPKFSNYAVVFMDYETMDWPEATKTAFVDYMKNGGGLVTIHAADNSFPNWPEFNEMIGVGGWGLTPTGGVNARKSNVGLKVRWRDGHTVTEDTPGGYGHPPPRDFVVTARMPDHPVMKGLPTEWMHSKDEIYSNLRGPAQNVTILATAKSTEDEPMLMAISYGKGRIFHSTLGHVGPNSKPPFLPLTSVGFIVTIQRGTEWAATGKVTQKVPADFPTADKVSNRNPPAEADAAAK
jgi:uncharacterized protein